MRRPFFIPLLFRKSFMSSFHFYQSNISSLESVKLLHERKLRNYRFLRFLVFLLTLFGGFLTFGHLLMFASVVFSSIVLFLVMVSKYTDLKTELEIIITKIQLNQFEINALNGDFSDFNSGEKYANPKHPFSSDLDLFKKNGVFAFLNRTTSNLGEKHLVSMLLDGNENAKEVSTIINELSKNINWSIHFRAVALINSREDGKSKLLTSLPFKSFVTYPWMKFAKIVIPVVAFCSLILFNLDLISSGFFSLLIVLTLVPSSIELKNTNAISNELATIEERLQVVKDQMKSLNELSLLKNDSLFWGEAMIGTKPSEVKDELDELLKIINRFNTRNNILLGMAFNFFFGWDMYQRIALDKWVQKNKEKVGVWENGLANIEAIVSIAFIRYNYPQTIFGQQSRNNTMSMKGLVHPLLAHAKSIDNDFELDTSKQFMILTGPNMAGKSTYLRAVACAVIFANAGFPIFATDFSCSSVQLYTSMRTSDDLSENSSYFFAELSRLRMIMDAVVNKQHVFVLLDEILKGTNSKDKEEGSYLFMEKMQKIGAKGIIATHDLSLCQLESKNNAFFTGHFDSTIDEGDLSFDYKLKNGICQNMNASFLLKKMNLID